MAFFLGKDVTLKVSTENGSSGVNVSAAGAITYPSPRTDATDFARALGADVTINPTWQQITSLDVSIGAMDEDISYFGIRSQTKAEIKKETTVTITRKKTNPEWDVVYNDARYGTTGTTAWDGLEEPTTEHGYRLYIQIDPAGGGTDEWMTVLGACVQSHTVTINTDGTMDETIEFMSYITPVFQSTAYVTAIGTNL